MFPLFLVSYTYCMIIFFYVYFYIRLFVNTMHIEISLNGALLDFYLKWSN